MSDRDVGTNGESVSVISEGVVRIVTGENYTQTSKGTWLFVGNTQVWGHVGSEGPLSADALEILNALAAWLPEVSRSGRPT